MLFKLHPVIYRQTLFTGSVSIHRTLLYYVLICERIDAMNYKKRKNGHLVQLT